MATPHIGKNCHSAFENIIPAWQEALNRSESGLRTFKGEQVAQTGRECSAIIRPCYSDFVADVQICANRALTPDQLAHFNAYYRDTTRRIDEMSKSAKVVDITVRNLVGLRLIQASVYPLDHYLQPVDTRYRCGSARPKCRRCRTNG